ncbi:hypothetical protein EB75_28100 [Mycobacterium sp. ST-F2]|uniref:hypothetical protein n=1 Tax=Mycobacterium sp. ST-F2 TaxID=1490484 RepID=UPI00093D3105|nr:hypothetical protein [Mycobacterium sp. ST-F2]OKH78292.1 hypothetical protein EB75_28100 [Mycobacterium sp. ST-F2]
MTVRAVLVCHGDPDGHHGVEFTYWSSRAEAIEASIELATLRPTVPRPPHRRPPRPQAQPTAQHHQHLARRQAVQTTTRDIEDQDDAEPRRLSRTCRGRFGAVNS